MTKAQAINDFMNSFGMVAYPNTAVPDETVFPWITYSVGIGNPGEEPTDGTIQLWFHTDSEAVPNVKVEELARAIGLGGILLPYDGGAIWVKRGTPWSVSTTAQDDNSIKMRQLNITLEFL